METECGAIVELYKPQYNDGIEGRLWNLKSGTVFFMFDIKTVNIYFYIIFSYGS